MQISKILYKNIFRFASEGVLKILVGNKCDLEEQRQVTSLQGKTLANQYNISFFETSASDNLNIDALFLETLINLKK